MKANIRDIDVLIRIKFLEVASYLKSKSWKEIQREEGRYSVWLKDIGNENIEILLPLDSKLRDYPARIAEAIQALEVDENRSQLDILSDIQNVMNDVNKIGVEHEDFNNGTVPLSYGMELAKHTHGLILAAACGAVRPREFFPARKPTQAVEYVRRTRLGQSERGSYVLTIQSPIPTITDGKLEQQMSMDLDDPFERRVTRTLMGAISAVNEAVSVVQKEKEPASFMKAVDLGASANLCEAIVGIQEGTEAQRIRIQMNWSPARNVDGGTPTLISIPAESIPIIKDGSIFLRTVEPRGDFRLIGPVAELKWPQNAQSGTVIIAGNVDGDHRYVRLNLSRRDYEIAIKAHQEGLILRCEGDLLKRGRTYILLAPHSFSFETGLKTR